MIREIHDESKSVGSINGMHQSIREKITIPKTLTPYLLYLRRNHKSKTTIEIYERDLLKFHSFLKGELNNRIKYLEKLTKTEMNFYKDYLMKNYMDENFAGSTVRRRFHSLKTYFNFLNEEYCIENIIKRDNFAKGFPDSSESISDKVFSDEEISILLKSLEEDKTKNIYRDKLMIYILYSTGCRKSEMLNLRWRDINITKKEIRINRSKTKNYDVVPLKDEVVEMLVNYTAIYGMKSEYIFHSSRNVNKPMSSSTFNQMFKRKIANANLRDDLIPHSLRHTFITTCLRKGISPQKIIKYTGHASTYSLKPYVHFTAVDLNDVCDAIDFSIVA